MNSIHRASHLLYVKLYWGAPSVKCPVSLPDEGLMNELAAQGLIGSIRSRFTDVLGPHVCFHTIPYLKNHHSVLGKYITLYFHDLFNVPFFDIYMICPTGELMWTVPKCSHMVLSKHTYPSCPDAEQVVVLTLTGQNIVEKEMDFLHKVLKGDAAGT